MTKFDQINALARKFYSRYGYEVEEGYDFSTASHPQERLMFALAVDAINFCFDELGMRPAKKDEK